MLVYNTSAHLHLCQGSVSQGRLLSGLLSKEEDGECKPARQRWVEKEGEIMQMVQWLLRRACWDMDAGGEGWFAEKV